MAGEWAPGDPLYPQVESGDVEQGEGDAEDRITRRLRAARAEGVREGRQWAIDALRDTSTRLLVLQHLWTTGGSCSCGWKDEWLPYGVHLASVFAAHLEAGGQLRHPALAKENT